MSQAQCSHSRVIRILDQTGTDCTREYWECPGCKTRFHPEPTDMHRIRLRDQFAATPLNDRELDALIQQATVTIGKPMSLAELRYFNADQMLKERDKKS